ncbi:MAG: glycosyltransferase [Thermoplasmataceae archaeon]
MSEQDKHFDLVIVPSNEGKWIGQFLRRFPRQFRPLTMLTIMELHENGMFMSHGNSLKRIASPFFYPIFFILQFFEKARISSFDIISANSMWTGQLLSYFYGINSTIEMNMYDGNLFNTEIKFPPSLKKYIAVSTVSIQDRHRDWIEKLERDGIDIIAFGSRKINSKSYEGFVSDEKLHEILANASATLFLFDYEAFGLIPLESLISGTPVITEPKMGVLTTYRDSKDVHFAESYGEILSLCKRFLSTEKTDEISKRCKNWAEKYSPHTITEKIMSEYEKAREKQGKEQLF